MSPSIGKFSYELLRRAIQPDVPPVRTVGAFDLREWSWTYFTRNHPGVNFEVRIYASGHADVAGSRWIALGCQIQDGLMRAYIEASHATANLLT